MNFNDILLAYEFMAKDQRNFDENILYNIFIPLVLSSKECILD